MQEEMWAQWTASRLKGIFVYKQHAILGVEQLAQPSQWTGSAKDAEDVKDFGNSVLVSLLSAY